MYHKVKGDEKGANLCARWLIAQLKFTASLLHRFGELVNFYLQNWNGMRCVVMFIWIGIWLRLLRRKGLVLSLDSDSWEERSGRDPSARRIREIVIRSNVKGEEFSASKVTFWLFCIIALTDAQAVRLG